MTDSANDTAEPGKSPFSFGFWIAGAILAAIVIVGVFVAVGVASGNTDEPDSSEPSTSAEPSTAAPVTDSVCGLEDGDQSIPTTSAPETEWELVGKIAAPSIEGVGPGKVSESGLRTCFAHSPVGAVLAAANMYAQGSDPALQIDTLEYFVLDGTGKEAALASARENGASGAGGAQFVGFKVVEYHGDEATVEIVGRNATGALVSFPTVLEWHGGDWRVILQDNGQVPIPPKQVTSLAGYLEWSGT